MNHDVTAVSEDQLSPELTATLVRVDELETELAAAATKIENLHTALVTARSIGAAIGVLMALHRVDEAAAFTMLREVSQCRNRKLREIAEVVRRTGALPDD